MKSRRARPFQRIIDRSRFPAAAEQALARRDFIEVLHLVDRNDAVAVFRDLARQLSDTEYWSLLGQAWMRIDSPTAHMRSLRRFLTSRRPEREAIMPNTDRAEFASMSDPIRIHRGCLSRDRGWSWTIAEDRAHWFAWDRVRRHGGPVRRGVVLSGFVTKSDVIAFLNQRNETEIIVDPSNVKTSQSSKLTSIAVNATPTC